MEALLKFKESKDDVAVCVGRLIDGPFFYILSDLGNEILYRELRLIQKDIEYHKNIGDFNLDEYIKYFNGKLYFEKED